MFPTVVTCFETQTNLSTSSGLEMSALMVKALPPDCSMVFATSSAGAAEEE